MLFNLDISVHHGRAVSPGVSLQESTAALSLKASRENEIWFPKPVKTLCLCVCECVCVCVYKCVSHHHTWLAQVCELYMLCEMILFYSRKMEK